MIWINENWLAVQEEVVEESVAVWFVGFIEMEELH